ncbi:hypothetical protein CA603_31875 [Paraburkholderia hospita]|nr:hypothetical protein CA603_31875 [Paraburkholderia hospita]
MISYDIETYRGFVVRMQLEQSDAWLACTVTFARPERTECAPVPSQFECHTKKANVSALTFTVAMQTRARAVVDSWLEQQRGQSSGKSVSEVPQSRLRSGKSR